MGQQGDMWDVGIWGAVGHKGGYEVPHRDVEDVELYEPWM